jgi:uroporphyrinogen decarboxylase
MRQAGRALPEYRALREKYSFLELVQQPDLAVEVTLQPIRRFGFDAAVIFSDILVASEALGQSYRFREEGGIQMEFRIERPADIERLQVDAVAGRLSYLSASVAGVRKALAGGTAVLGFAGAPWTLANFMIEGGSVEEFRNAKRMYYEAPDLFNSLLERITEAVVILLRLQIDAGADAVQIFDSLAELLSADAYEAASGRWIRRILQRLQRDVPVILYVRGLPGAVDRLVDSGLRAFSVDWRMDLPGLRTRLPPHLAVQGNLDPFLMTTTPETVHRATRRLLEGMANRPGFIVNLGHGLPPDAGLGNIESMVATVRESVGDAYVQ